MAQRARIEPSSRRQLSAFLFLTFAISWGAALVMRLAGIELGTTPSVVLVVATFMWAPGIAAVIVARRSGVPVRAALGLRVGSLRWVAIAWVAPLLLVAVTVGLGVLMPGVSYTADPTTYLEGLGLTDEQVAQAAAALRDLSVPPAVLFAVQGLLAGLTINALAALGEELGWRGLMLTHLAPLGFWRASALTGLVWGVWHAPIIVQGHNFPDHPVAGVAVMTLATIALAPFLTYVTVRARSVLAATFFHGSLNAVGALTLVYLAGAGPLVVAPVGLLGIVAALLLTGVCLVHDRFVADTPITTGAPLQPWHDRPATNEVAGD